MYSTYLTDRTQGPNQAESALMQAANSPEREQIAAVWDTRPGAPVLEPYVLVGAGTGRDDAGEAFTTVVLVHRSEQAALANANLLQRRIAEIPSLRSRVPWAERFSSVDIETDGITLTAVLHGSDIGHQFLVAGDPLLLHR